MTRKKLIIGVIIVVVLAGLAYGNYRFRRTDTMSVTVETIARHDLEAVVSASGKIQPSRQVEISAETVGKVVNLAVAEGEVVKAGQLLLQIDPRNLESTVENREASLATARSQLDQTKAQVDNARVALRLADDTLRRQTDMFHAGLLARDVYEKSQRDAEMRRTDLQVAEQAVRTQEQRIKQEEANLANARYDLSKLRIVSPINGIVTRRNIEEGETVVMGTMNNAGTVLLTIADLSVIETEIEVDETDIPDIQIGQPARVTIDAFADRIFPGRVTEVGNSPIQVTGAQAQTGRATNFKVVVTIDGEVPNVRPGFTCTAVITTGTRKHALSVPIQAMTVRELIVDAEGNLVKTDPAAEAGQSRSRPAATPAELQPGQIRKEIEGVFTLQNGRAVFVPVKTGIAGERHFEVLEGLNEGDQVITGPFASVRSLRENDPVTVQSGPAAGQVSPSSR
jgi:HlyD family secretion protein